LTFGWEPSNNQYAFNDLNELVTGVRKFGIQSGDLSLEINQRIPTSNYESDEPKLTGKFTGNVKCNEMVFNSGVRDYLQSNPYTFPGPGIFGCLFLTGNVELRVHNLEDIVDMGLVPWPQEIPRFCGFNGLKNFVLPFAGEGLSSLPRDEGGINVYALITELYEKIYNSVTGISEIKVAFKNHIISVKFFGFELFTGYFPDIDTLKNMGGNQTNF